ncbi:hypothetical protein EGW08_004432 [Elysia chlorotica]|uniref:WSC domain-containing protein n=1 Tax=Elysia chlorotica TaxID=188477 RepID=A0A433U1X8_ELYCH|nr:hypothetical protein EGW08_004432 [Elysia chlorotica]
MIGKFFSVVLVAAVFAVNTEGSEVCRPEYPVHFISDSKQAINKGCYHSSSDSKVFPKESLFNLRSKIDWNQWVLTNNGIEIIRQCGQEAIVRNKAYFGVEFYGECYFGDTPDFSLSKVTVAENCTKLCGMEVGGASAMMVYEVAARVLSCPAISAGYFIDDTHWAWNMGCYAQSSASHVLPLGNVDNQSSKTNFVAYRAAGHAGDMVKICGQIAIQNGASFFGVENYGYCYYGNQPDKSDGEVACTPQKCIFDIGTKEHIVLYKVMDV